MTFPWRDAPVADFAVIGDPVKHSLSPKMHMAAYAALGLPYRYVAIHVRSGEVELALHHLKELGYKGVNVTVPHKEEALQIAQFVEPLAKRVRAANTFRLSDWSCINTDAPGFIDTLEDFKPASKTALVYGAGGSARAILVALAGAGYKVMLTNRTLEKARALVAELNESAITVTETADPTGASLLLNTTSASLTNDELPVQWEKVEPDALAYDLMYAKPSTPFLTSATMHGLKTIDGLPLLVAQGARAFEWWLSLEAPRSMMFEAIQ